MKERQYVKREREKGEGERGREREEVESWGEQIKDSGDATFLGRLRERLERVGE